MSDLLWQLDEVQLPGEIGPRLTVERLDIETGRTAVIGASGAGKTSLLNLLVEFERNNTGRIERFFDGDTQRLPIFWVPTHGGLWPHVSARDHLSAVAEPSCGPRQVESLLQSFDLADRADARPGELSAGEQSRLSVARALAVGATVLVMDEPFVHVDPARLAGYWKQLDAECQRHGTSLVFSTHSPEPVLRHADIVVCLAGGGVVGSGPVEELYLRSPTRVVAECLGPVNWFDASEAADWLGVSFQQPLGLRAEQLRVTRSETGTGTVVDSQRIGPVRETRVRLLTSHLERTLRHLASDGPLAAGHQVVLEQVDPGPPTTA